MLCIHAHSAAHLVGVIACTCTLNLLAEGGTVYTATLAKLPIWLAVVLAEPPYTKIFILKQCGKVNELIY